MKFTGHERDESLGLDYMLARYYTSGLGRFLSVDPVSASANTAEPRSWNRFAYVLDEPLRIVDPTGEFGQCNDGGVTEYTARMNGTYGRLGPPGSEMDAAFRKAMGYGLLVLGALAGAGAPGLVAEGGALLTPEATTAILSSGTIGLGSSTGEIIASDLPVDGKVDAAAVAFAAGLFGAPATGPMQGYAAAFVSSNTTDISLGKNPLSPENVMSNHASGIGGAIAESVASYATQLGPAGKAVAFVARLGIPLGTSVLTEESLENVETEVHERH